MSKKREIFKFYIMERAITFKSENKQINFSDLDIEEDCVVTIIEDEVPVIEYYLTPENLMVLKKHIDYLLTKI